jgi:DnaK suppressor protein
VKDTASKTPASSKPKASKAAAPAVGGVAAKAKPAATRAVEPAPAAKPVKAPVPVAATPSPSPSPRAGRPSSRLAQLTVPSMAQTVASTAAKSSYSQIMTSPQITPPAPGSVKKDPKLANNWKNKPVEQITDAELMAMSDDDYMNAAQLAVFRLKLTALKKDILSSAGETTEHLREDTVVVPDPADRATIEEEHALELRTRDRERKLLKKIEQSIMRIDAGDYGYCDETGEPIGVGRLLARPTATLSLEAQQRRELKQKMFGD